MKIFLWSPKRSGRLWGSNFIKILQQKRVLCRSQWPPCLRFRSAAARLLRLWVQFPMGAWKTVCCKCCVLSGRDLCNELITRPEESYRMWCVVVYDLETWWMRRSWPTGGLLPQQKKIEGALHENFSTFMITSCWIVFSVRNVSDERNGENQNTCFRFIFFFENRAFYELMWRHTVGSDRPQMTI